MMDMQYFICITTFDELRAIQLIGYELGLVEKLIIFEIPSSLNERVLRRIIFEDIVLFVNTITAEFYALQPHNPHPH